ncbi:multiprotein-bridging factor 1 family protein [Oricola sp.]|uniref:helix-turn-helix domain-containing protein n=1 Tax=Oricola sp. TaxID=1979950 RepID=UPI0035183FB6
MSTKIVDVDDKCFGCYLACMTPEQCRAARGWLDISQSDLAASANVSLSTVRDFEKGRRVPIGNNLSAIQSALESKGIAFTEAGITGPGN